MKLFVLLFSALACCCSPTAAAPAGRRWGSAAKVVTQPSATSTTLSIPRGGGGIAGLSQSDLIKLIIGAKLVNGLIPYAAPEVAASKLYNIQGVKEGTSEALWWEYFGSTSLGNALMIHLAVNKGMAPAKAVLWGGVGCTFVTFANLIKGNFAKFGFMKGFGTMQFVLMGSCLLLAALGKGDIEFLAKFFAIAPALTTLLCFVNLDLGAKVYGVASPTGSTKTIFAWMHEAVLSFYAVTAWSLLTGVSPSKAVGYGVLVKAAGLFDTFFLRKVTSVTPSWIGIAGPAFFALAGLGLVQA